MDLCTYWLLAGRGHALTLPGLHLFMFCRLAIDQLEKFCHEVLILTVATRSATQGRGTTQQSVLIREVRENGIATDDRHENIQRARQPMSGM